MSKDVDVTIKDVGAIITRGFKEVFDVDDDEDGFAANALEIAAAICPSITLEQSVQVLRGKLVFMGNADGTFRLTEPR